MEAQRFGARLRQLRKQAGLSQRELADRVGIDFTYLSKIENGVMPPPSEKVILQLAEVLNADKDELTILAGRIPSDLSQLLTKRGALRLARSMQQGQKILIASNKKRRSLQMNGKDFFKKYGTVKNYGKLSRVAVAAILVCAVAASLWYAAPARALTIDIPPASGIIGGTATITAVVNVESSDILPIRSVDLGIYDSTHSEKFEDLPLSAQSGVAYTGVNGSSASITAVPGSGWGYGYATSRGGYGYGYGIGWGYHWIPGNTFGYGYGYAPYTGGITLITYTIVWNVPSNWTSGSYTIRLWVNANGISFIQDGTLTLTAPVVGAAGPPAAPPAEEGATDVSDAVDPETGEFTETVTAESEDGNVEVTIEEGIIGKTKEGESISAITIVPMADPPDAPADSNTIGLTYDIGPDGATFDDPITLTFTYDEALLPDDAVEANLVLAVWEVDEATGEGAWVVLEGVVDTEANTITVSVNHLTAFTILAYTRPAAFAASDLSITPAAVGIGETVTISVLITNTGDLTDSYEVTLKIDNVVVSTEEVTLVGHASQKVTFTTSRDVAGTYTVTIDDLSKTFTVEKPPVEKPPVEKPPVEKPPVEALPQPPNWGLIGGIIGAVVVIGGLLAYFLWWRRRTV